MRSIVLEINAKATYSIVDNRNGHDMYRTAEMGNGKVECGGVWT